MSHPVRREFTLTAVIFAAGALFMVLLACTKSAWGDEAFSLRVASLPLKELLNAVAHDNHPPLQFLLYRLLFGITDPLNGGDWESRLLVARLFSIICWVGVVRTGLALTRELTGRPALPLAATALIWSPFLMLFCLMARYYSLLAFLVAFLLLRLVRRVERDRGSDGMDRPDLPFIAGAVALVHTNYLGVPLLFLMLLCAAAFGRSGRARIRRHLLSFAAPAVTLVPWLIFAWDKVRPAEAAPGRAEGLAAGLKTFAVDSGFTLWTMFWGEHLPPWLWPAGLVLILLLAHRAFLNIRERMRADSGFRRRMIPPLSFVPGAALLLLLAVSFIFSLGTEFVPGRLVFLGAPLLALALTGLIPERRLDRALLWCIVTLSITANLFRLTGAYAFQSTYDLPYRKAAIEITRVSDVSGRMLVLVDSDALALHINGGDFGPAPARNLHLGVPQEELRELWEGKGTLLLVANPGLFDPEEFVAEWNALDSERPFRVVSRVCLYRENESIYRMKEALGRSRSRCKLLFSRIEPDT